MPEGRSTCFIIMPFDRTTEMHTKRYWTDHFEKFLKPIIEENQKLIAFRSKPLRGDILKEILTNLVSVPIVVADITDYNPNVFWELGVRQSYRHGTITIAEEGVTPPFDISGKGILYYSNDHLKNEEFRTDFKEALKDCLENPNKSDSIVKEALIGKGTFFEFFQLDETKRRLQAVKDEHIWNDLVLKECVQIAKNNKGKDIKDCTIPSGRTRLVATELLLTDRYMDVDNSFYIQIGIYWADFIAINKQIDLWIHNKKGVEEWIITNENKFRMDSDKFRKKLDEILTEINQKI